MWVRILDSGQEIDMHDSTALRFISGGHAVKIDPPKPRTEKPTPASAVPLIPDHRVISATTSDAEIKRMAATLAYNNTGSASGLAHIFERLLKLERAVASLEIDVEGLRQFHWEGEIK